MSRDDQQRESYLRARLEQVSRSFFEVAVRNRDFDPPSSPLCAGVKAYFPYDEAETTTFWQHCIPHFRVEPGYLGTPSTTLEELLRIYQRMTTEFPEFESTVRHTSSTVGLETGRAQVFMNVETTGMPAGVTRQSMGVMTWRRIEERWMMVAYKCMQGAGHG